MLVVSLDISTSKAEPRRTSPTNPHVNFVQRLYPTLNVYQKKKKVATRRRCDRCSPAPTSTADSGSAIKPAPVVVPGVASPAAAAAAAASPAAAIAAAPAAPAAPAPDDGGCWGGTFESDGIGPSVATIRVPTRDLAALALTTPPRELPPPEDRRHSPLRAPAQPPVEKLETRLAKSSVIKDTLDTARTIRVFGCNLLVRRILASTRPSFSSTTDTDETCAIFAEGCSSLPNGVKGILVVRRDSMLVCSAFIIIISMCLCQVQQTS